jgi:hypothetical protein
MGLFDKLFAKEEKASVAVETPPCAHGVLTPRWDSVNDMGKEDRATSYFCEACREEFSPHEARALRESMAARLPVGDS